MDQDFDQIDRAYDANEADVESGYIFNKESPDHSTVVKITDKIRW